MSGSSMAVGPDYERLPTAGGVAQEGVAAASNDGVAERFELADELGAVDDSRAPRWPPRHDQPIPWCGTRELHSGTEADTSSHSPLCPVASAAPAQKMNGEGVRRPPGGVRG